MRSVDMILMVFLVLVAIIFIARIVSLQWKERQDSARQDEVIKSLDNIGYNAGRMGKAPNFCETDLGVSLSAFDQLVLLTGWKRGWKELQETQKSGTGE